MVRGHPEPRMSSRLGLARFNERERSGTESKNLPSIVIPDSIRDPETASIIPILSLPKDLPSFVIPPPVATGGGIQLTLFSFYPSIAFLSSIALAQEGLPFHSFSEGGFLPFFPFLLTYHPLNLTNNFIRKFF
jgi:hypothetical protein